MLILPATTRSSQARSQPKRGQTPPPVDHLHASASWLLGRHPQLAELAARIPDCVERVDDELTIDLDLLAQSLVELDLNVDAWEVYSRRHPAPANDHAWEQWCARGPVSTPHVDALSVMSGSEQTRLRLLAAFASPRVPIRVADLRSMDAAGQLLLADGAAAVCAA